MQIPPNRRREPTCKRCSTSCLAQDRRRPLMPSRPSMQPTALMWGQTPAGNILWHRPTNADERKRTILGFGAGWTVGYALMLIGLFTAAAGEWMMLQGCCHLVPQCSSASACRARFPAATPTKQNWRPSRHRAAQPRRHRRLEEVAVVAAGQVAAGQVAGRGDHHQILQRACSPRPAAAALATLYVCMVYHPPHQHPHAALCGL